MSQIDPLDRRALGILSSAINKQLGVSNLVSREVDRAYRSGEIKDFTGISRVYEEPLSPEITIDSGNQDLSNSVEIILNRLRELKII